MARPGFAAGLWPSANATQRIIDAVGKRHTPATLEVSSLRTALYEFRSAILRRRLGAAEHRRAHRKAALKIAKRAAELRKLLKASGNGQLDRELWFHLEPNLMCTDLAEIERVANMLTEQDASSDAGAPLKDYATKLLAPIYEQHFGPAGRSNNGAKIYGPFVSFVQAVWRAIDKKSTISGSTVDKALAERNRDIIKIPFSANKF